MFNPLTKTYQINYSFRQFCNFEWILLTYQTIITENSLRPVNKILFLNSNYKSLISIWKKVENEKHPELSPEPGKGTLITVSENELVDYLVIFILLSKIFDSRYYIMLKEKMPDFKKSKYEISAEQGIEISETLDLGLENLSYYFTREAKIFLRLAKRRLRGNQKILAKLKAAEEIII